MNKKAVNVPEWYAEAAGESVYMTKSRSDAPQLCSQVIGKGQLIEKYPAALPVVPTGDPWPLSRSILAGPGVGSWRCLRSRAASSCDPGPTSCGSKSRLSA